MPTYAYACTTCDEQVEVVQRFTDAPLTDCPSCEGSLRKVFTPVGIVFKGSGFYKTDTRSSNRSSAAAKPGDKPTDKPTDKSAESAPAAPATSAPAPDAAAS